METMPIKQDNLASISNLLQENKLPYEDLLSSQVIFITRKSREQLIACIGIEQYGSDALLRSFAVDDSYKSKGIGTELLHELLNKCKEEGIKTLHLLTTTAAEYFEKKGFLRAERLSAPIAISHSKEFSELCPSSSVYMRRDITELIPS
ncbi:GNAT family N-acetyltransferase [Marivirga lumbricoides]|uniref:GNAT family N-acetyltransferase n=1 Tax=Marivirga lumbricoides TaxID=1046115 RepID=A0A2T4DTC3_9BACT|nr:GNAT family N-acetyltransferase [Marivirga lumbricoides]